MGGGSKTQQSTQATQTTVNTDNSIGLGSNSSVIGSGQGSTVNITDGGSVAAALSSNAAVANSALSANANVSNYAIGTVSQVADSALASNLANNKGALALASQSLDLNAQGTRSAFSFGNDAFDFANTQNARAFDYIGEATGTILDSVNRDRQANQDLTANLARSAVALADGGKTNSQDQVLNLGKIALYVVGALIAVFLLFRPSSSKA